MVYRKRPSKSRRYKKVHSQENPHTEQKPLTPQPALSEETIITQAAGAAAQDRKKSQPFGFLSSLLGGDKIERSGDPLFRVFDFDIYLDDLLLVGLIILLLTDKVQDEILIIVLIYLLIDIF